MGGVYVSFWLECSYDPPEGHHGKHTYTNVIRILSTSLTSVSIFSVCCCSMYLSLWSKPSCTWSANFLLLFLKGHCYDRSMKGCRSLNIILNLPQLFDWPNPAKYVTYYIINFYIFKFKHTPAWFMVIAPSSLFLNRILDKDFFELDLVFRIRLFMFCRSLKMFSASLMLLST